MKGDKSSFSMSGHVPYIYGPTVTRVALAASVSQIRKDLPRICFKLVSEYSAYGYGEKKGTHRQSLVFWAFSSLYPLSSPVYFLWLSIALFKIIHGHNIIPLPVWPITLRKKHNYEGEASLPHTTSRHRY